MSKSEKTDHGEPGPGDSKEALDRLRKIAETMLGSPGLARVSLKEHVHTPTFSVVIEIRKKGPSGMEYWSDVGAQVSVELRMEMRAIKIAPVLSITMNGWWGEQKEVAGLLPILFGIAERIALEESGRTYSS